MDYLYSLVNNSFTNKVLIMYYDLCKYYYSQPKKVDVSDGLVYSDYCIRRDAIIMEYYHNGEKYKVIVDRTNPNIKFFNLYNPKKNTYIDNIFIDEVDYTEELKELLGPNRDFHSFELDTTVYDIFKHTNIKNLDNMLIFCDGGMAPIVDRNAKMADYIKECL